MNFLSSFGIILVVLGHSMYPGCRNFVSNYIYSFHMPLFAFISGYLFIRYTNIKNYWNFVCKKSSRLLIPYVFWIVAMFIVKFVFSSLSSVDVFINNPIEFDFNVLCNMLLYPSKAVISYYWFAIVLFFIFIIFASFIKKNIEKHTLQITLIFIVLYYLNPLNDCQLFQLNRLFDLLPYFYFGCIFSLYNFNFNFILKYTILTKWIILLVLNIILVIYILNISRYDLFTGVLGIAICLVLSMLYEYYKLDFLKLFYHNTAAIYFLHGIVNALLLKVLVYLKFNMYIYTLTQFLFCLIVPIIIVKIVEKMRLKNKFIYYIIGK